MIREKQGAEYAKAHHSRGNFWASWIVSAFFFFFAFVESKEKNQRKSSTLKHAVVK